MKLDDLQALGFIACAGMIDRLGKNYGVLTPAGPVLTPEGEELAKSLMELVADEPVKRKPGRPPKAVE